MKQKDGFIATSLLYSFFLAFITIFIAMITIYLQNRVYLNKLEDSSKNSIYIREIQESLPLTIKMVNEDGTISEKKYSTFDDNIFSGEDGTCNFAKCENIYYNGSHYILEGCTSC